MRPLLLAALGLAILPARIPAQETPPLTLEAVLEAVRERHPAIAARRSRVEALRQEARADRSWDDPVLGLNVMRDGRRPLSHSEFEVEVSQALPLSRSNRLAAAVTGAEAGEAAAEVDVAALSLFSAARRAYYDLAYLQAQLDVLDRTDVLLGNLVTDLEAKFASGDRPQSDVLTAELERVVLQEEVSTLRGRAAARRVELNVLMSRPATAALGDPAPLTFDFDVTPLEDYVAAARARHPGLRAAEAAVDTAAARRDLAGRRRVPDPEVRLMLRRINGSNTVLDSYDTGVAFRLPWVQRGKYAAIESAARAGETAAEEDYAASQQVLLGRVAELWHLLASFRDCCLLFRDQAMPLARSALEAAQRDFASGRIPLADLLNATRNLFRVESMLNEFLQEYYLGYAELLEATGLIDPLPRNSSSFSFSESTGWKPVRGMGILPMEFHGLEARATMRHSGSFEEGFAPRAHPLP